MAVIKEVNGVFGGVELGKMNTQNTNADNTIANSYFGNNVVGNNFGGNTENGNNVTGTNSGANCGTNKISLLKGGAKAKSNLPVKAGFWSKFKNFWLQEINWNYEIKVELTPYQQKVEDEINEFLHQEITWESVHDFLFQEVSFGKKN